MAIIRVHNFTVVAELHRC